MADDSNDDHKSEGEDDGLLASPSPSPTKLDVSNFQCPHPGCGRSYASKHGLDNHNRVHFTDNEKPFACPHPGCLSRYTNKRGVTRHFNLKHKDKSDWFNCPTAEQLKLHQREHGVFRCTARHCAYEYTTEQELYDHRERNHTTSDLYEDRAGKRPSGISKKEDLSAQFSSGEGTADEIVVDENPTKPEFREDEDNFENSSSSQTPTYRNSNRRDTTSRVSLKAEEYPARPNRKGWKCPKPGCTVCRKVQFDLITHWQEAHSDIPEPAHFEFVHGPKSSENTNNSPKSMANDHRLGDSSDENSHLHPRAKTGQSTSAGQPAQPNQEEAGRNNASDGSLGLNSQQHRGKDANATENKNTNMNDLNAPNAAITTPSIASSRSSMATNNQGRTPRSNNGPPIIPPPRHPPSVTRSTTTVLASSTGNLSGPAETPSINNRRKKAAAGHPAQRIHARATEARRMSPPPARSNPSAKSAVAFINTRIPPQRQSQVSSPDSSHRSSPVRSDGEEEEEGLFVSPPDTTKSQTKGPRRVLGVRGFANMPLPRDQDSGEEDLRPSHVLRQERRAAAGKPVKPDHSREFLGAGRKIFGQRRKVGESTRFSAAGSTDSDDNSNFEGSEFSSSGSSFGEAETVRSGRRSKNHLNARASNSVPCRPSVKKSDPPRTPSPDLPRYQPYEVYGPDLDSPPPSYLVKSPGVIDRTLPYPSRPEDKTLPDVAAVQPDDLFDADDIFFSFRDMTPHEREVQDRLDVEKDAMRVNAYGSGIRAPLHFDHCPYTAPICRTERAAWVAERLRLDVEEAHGDESEDPETPSRLDCDDDRQFGVDVEMTGTGTSALSKKKRATCSGPLREKRKYNWRDPARKNKRRKGSLSGSISRRASNRRSNSGGNSQIDGADEQEEVVAKNQKPIWVWSEEHGAVINTRKPVELVRPGALAAEDGVVLPGPVDRASAAPSVGSDDLNASGAPAAAAGSSKTSIVLSDTYTAV
ncbi:putative transcription factor c2h2 protein [Botrytis fragariae]|uniref:Putative transcription factor c2h2 protein n=1 Tax=Botrytis fragariae TaxID=1964551 RepID=A0A8H6EJ79_9HELO|nr:putative transcription factor c2h2 protein [Botrytis fragariae]KAF5874216.1 putative transcription factor c2h2 protein [Botrytis fragariae]